MLTGCLCGTSMKIYWGTDKPGKSKSITQLVQKSHNRGQTVSCNSSLEGGSQNQIT